MHLNLDPQYVYDYFQIEDRNFNQFLHDVSAVEKWALTGNANFQRSLTEFTEQASNWKTSQYSDHTDSIIQLMSYMNIAQFAYFFHYMDTMFPGLSIHFIMSAKDDEAHEVNQLLLQRVKLINEYNFLDKVLTPMRKRLATNLLYPKK